MTDLEITLSGIKFRSFQVHDIEEPPSAITERRLAPIGANYIGSEYFGGGTIDEEV